MNLVFFEHTVENAVGSAADAALAALGGGVVGVLGNVPWYGVLSVAGGAALVSVLRSLSSLKVQPDNGTASNLPRVVAKRK